MGVTWERPNKKTARYRIWQSIRELKAFTIDRLIDATGASRTNIRNFIDRLRHHGYVFAYQSELAAGQLSFMLNRDTGPDYPMLCSVCRRPLGKKCVGTGEHRPKPNKSAARYKLWQSIRIFRRFDLADLVRTSGAGMANARHFVDQLREHGYVAVSGKKGLRLAFRLVKDTGPDYPLRCEVCGRPLGKKCTGGKHGK